MRTGYEKRDDIVNNSPQSREDLRQIIEEAWEKVHDTAYITQFRPQITKSILTVLRDLNLGQLSICSKVDSLWSVNEWIKKALILYLRFEENKIIKTGQEVSYDKVKLKFTDWTEEDFKRTKIRAVQGAIVRYGTYLGNDCIILPAFIGIGARVGDATMIDSCATVGSGACIGKRVHVSSGVTLGGVIEPIQARPVIIEDNAFIGANSSLVEGAVVSEGAVLANGCHLSGATKIYDRIHNTITYGTIPPHAVAVPGYIKNIGAGENKIAEFGTSAVIIVKYADEATRAKTSINDLLRDLSSI